MDYKPKTESGALAALSLIFFLPVPRWPRLNLPQMKLWWCVWSLPRLQEAMNHKLRLKYKHKTTSRSSSLALLQTQVMCSSLWLCCQHERLPGSLNNNVLPSLSLSLQTDLEVPQLELSFVSASKNFLFILCFPATSFSAPRGRHKRLCSVIRRDKMQA